MAFIRVIAVSTLAAIAGCSPPEQAAPSLDDSAFSLPFPDLPGPITPLQKPVIENPEKAALGKSLFSDPRLSRSDTIACSSCHDLTAGGDDGRRVPVGVDGRRGYLNTPTVLNSSLNVAQFWDGRARTLEEQILATVENPVEMDGDWPTIEQRLRADTRLAERFDSVYGEPATKQNVTDALAAYLRVLITLNSPLDRYLKGEETALDENGRAGYELFTNLGCVSCHQGRNIGGNFFQHFGVMGDYFAERDQATEADLGRYNVTGREEDRYKFKVPSLRNVAETAPYFHDGSAPTLEDAVEVMVEYQLGRSADESQVQLLVAFLESLSGEIEERWR
jgi:cytochrome c peroxidase